MIEIRLRFWHKEYKKFVSPYGLGYQFQPENGQVYVEGMNITDRFIVSRFTGLKDKKGKEISEGDIVKQEYHKVTGSYDDYETFTGHHIGEVVVIASKGVCMRNPICYSEDTDQTERSNQYKSVSGYRCEIIGNIYANADLLDLALAPPSDSINLA